MAARYFGEKAKSEKKLIPKIPASEMEKPSQHIYLRRVGWKSGRSKCQTRPMANGRAPRQASILQKL